MDIPMDRKSSKNPSRCLPCGGLSCAKLFRVRSERSRFMSGQWLFQLSHVVSLSLGIFVMNCSCQLRCAAHVVFFCVQVTQDLFVWMVLLRAGAGRLCWMTGVNVGGTSLLSSLGFVGSTAHQTLAVVPTT